MFLDSKIPNKLQLLIHPFFWSDYPGDRWDRLDKWIELKRQSLANCQDDIRKLWSNHIAVKEHENRKKTTTKNS